MHPEDGPEWGELPSPPRPTYCTPEMVAEAMDLPDPEDSYGYFRFSDLSHPSHAQVCRMIVANEDIIDQRLKQSWRVNYVKDYVTTIPQYQWDEASWRTGYYLNGGNAIQLRRHVLEWDPEKGDKLEFRTFQGGWYDASKMHPDDEDFRDDRYPRHGPFFWFDYPKGRLFVRTRRLQARYNAIRITYRYGNEGPVPYAIQRICTLMTAINVLNMQAWSIKVGLGGDLAGTKDAMVRAWQDEINSILSSYQRAGSVHGLLRG